MALMNISENAGGDFLPIVKYDSRAGRIFRVDRADGTSTPVDITRSFKALFDFEQVEVGYIMFSAGGAPDFRMAPYGQPLPAKPVGDYKQGVRLRIKLAPGCGGDVRELAGTANAFLRGINAVHDEYVKLAPANPGKLPVLVLQDTIGVESGSGSRKSTNYTPVFSIEGWAARPADMPLVETQAPAPRQSANGAMPPPVSTNDANRAANTDDFG
jgi:hypothetical protein